MFVLPVETRGPLIALRDDLSPSWVVAPVRPRLARSLGGAPLLRLDRWVLPSTSSGVAPAIGGRLNLTVALMASPEEIAATNLVPGTVASIPWLDASIELNGPLFGPIVTEVAVASGAIGAIATELPEEAAAVLASLLTREVVSPLQVTWTGWVFVRLPAVEIVASAAIDRAVLQTPSVGFSRRLVARSIIEATARIEIRGANNPQLEAVFRDWALEELTRCCVEGRALSVRAGAAQVVRWPIRLSTTLDDLIGSDSRQELVHIHALDPSELGKPPRVEIRVLGAFGNALERVDIRLTPTDGAVKDLSISSEAPQSVELGTGNFSWSFRAKPVSHPPGEWSVSRTADNSFSLLIPISTPKDLSVEVLASGLDFTHRWSLVRVELSHQGLPQDAESTVIELDSTRLSAVWKKNLMGPLGKVRALLTYLSYQGQQLEVEVSEVFGRQLIVEDPLSANQRRLAIIPTGNGWGGIAVAMVDLRYRDGDFQSEETIELKSSSDFVEWVIPARKDGPRAIEWRCHASFQDGRFEESKWQSMESEVLAVPLQAPATRQVQLVPVFFDVAKTPRADIHLRNQDHLVTVPITNKSTVSVTLPQGLYSWSVAWTLSDGSKREIPEQVSDQDVIVLPRSLS